MAGHHMPTRETRSTCTPVKEHGSHVFDIFGYSVHKATGGSDFISSGTFSVSGHDWNIRFYPNDVCGGGDGAAVQHCISIFLALMSKGAKVWASCALSLVDQTTGQPSPVHRTAAPTEFRYGDDSMLFPAGTAFMDRGEFEASAFLRDDRLTVRCDLTVIKQPMVFMNKFAGMLAPPPSDITEHLAALLETGEGADVAFVVGEETFVAHRFLLAARSPVFRAELLGPMREARSQLVAIEDMQPEVFRALLHFIYTDSLPAMDDDVPEDADNKMIQHLLVAANRYCMDRLKSVCEDILCNSLALDNVATTLALAYHYNCPKLKNFCLKQITDSNALERVKATEGYRDLKNNYPYILADAFEKASKMHKK